MSAGNASRNRTLPADKGMHAHCIFKIKDKAKCDGMVALPGCLTFVGTKDAQSSIMCGGMSIHGENKADAKRAKGHE